MSLLANNGTKEGSPSSPERALWCAVLLAGLYEQLTGKVAGNNKARPDLNWSSSRGFVEVCNLAGFDAQAIREKLRRGDVDARRLKSGSIQGEDAT